MTKHSTASLTLAATLIAFCTSATFAQEPPSGLQTAACQIRIHSEVPAPRLLAVARGFNLTGWLDQATPRRPEIETLRRLRERGFSHVRLPVQPELLMPNDTEQRLRQQHWQELDRALDSLLGLGFAVSIDVHPGAKFGELHRTQPERGLALLSALWRALADRYRSRPADRLFFEILNEPTADARTWDRQGRTLAAEIRKHAPRHTIIYGPGNFQSIPTLVDLAPLADPNVIYAVHFYQPMTFTHQGLDWSPKDPLRFLSDIPFPSTADPIAVKTQADRLMKEGHIEAAQLLRNELRSPWTPARITAELARAGAWATTNHRPVIVNEFGALSLKSQPADRARWIATVRYAAEQNCLGWAHWEYADSFGFVRREGGRDTIDERVLDALVGDRSF
jgi:endoglucanase